MVSLLHIGVSLQFHVDGANLISDLDILGTPYTHTKKRQRFIFLTCGIGIKYITSENFIS
jgi:hypothetical protein